MKESEGCPPGFDPSEFATQTCFLGRYGPELGSDEFGGIIFIFAGQNQPHDVETVIARFSNVELYHVGQAFKKGKQANLNFQYSLYNLNSRKTIPFNNFKIKCEY